MTEAKVAKRDSGEVTGLRYEKTLTPSVDVFENDNEFLLMTDLPGVTTENLSVDYNNNILSIEAIREAAEAKPGSGGAAVSYRRSFNIPTEVDPSAIEAKLKHGVLSLHLPKHERLQSRQIAVSAEK